MKVLHLRSGGGLYGAEMVILALARGLSEAGHDAAVMNLRPPGRGSAALVEAARNLGLESQEIACGSKLDFAAVRALNRYLRGRRVDLIHSHDYKSDFYAFLCGRANEVPFVATCHNWASDQLRMRLYKAVNKLLMRRFSKVAAVSEPLRKELLLSGIDDAKLVMIPNGVPVPGCIPPDRSAKIRESLGIGADEGVVISVGRLSPEKGHLNLIAAAPAVAAARPRSRFLIVGDGPLRLELEEATQARRLGASVMFLGERRDVGELLAASDVFVLPSFKEGLPLALLEAMARRKPVIAAPVGEIPTVVTHGVSGLLIDPADAPALARAIIRLLGSPAEAAALAGEGLKRVRDDYSDGTMIRRYVDLYLEVLAP
jgi:glycosyltransferase involved in cell wall biosynthesis